MYKIRNMTTPYIRGILLCFIIALAADFLGSHYKAPTMLFALLLGMAFNFLSQNQDLKPGIDLSAKKILRIGIALLGLRIAFSDVIAIGWKPIVLIILGVITTILLGFFIARFMGLKRRFGVLSGGAVAICGASAALAISAAMPQNEKLERDTAFTIVGVTTLSTIAMIVYPLISNSMGMTETEAGLFFGATIHDVAQVVGAGFSVSDTAGNMATMTKLMRVALLVPVVLIIALSFRGQASDATKKAPLLPFFLVMFLAMVAINSFGLVPDTIRDIFVDISKYCLITSIAAVGVKTNLKSIAEVGFKPALLMIIETVWIGVLVLLALPLMG